jgi:hypothetical protein
MLRNRLLRTLTLLSCVAIASGDGYDLRGLERLLLERYLPSELPDCPGETVNMFYDMNFTIEEAFDDSEIDCPVDDENCTDYVGNCTDNDFINIGLLLVNITAEVEATYPKFRDEFVDTKVCAVPYIAFDDEGSKEQNDLTVITQEQGLPPWIGGRRNLATATTTKAATSTTTKKKRGRYVYTSGGRCRRCTVDDSDRRALAATAKNISQKEAAVEACSFAESAKFAREVAQRGLASGDRVVTEVKELALGYKDVDLAEEFFQNVTAMRNVVKDLEGKAKKAMDDADHNCDLAKGASTNSKLVSQTLHYMSQAENKSETAVSYAKTVYGVYRNMTNTKLELKKLVLNQL